MNSREYRISRIPVIALTVVLGSALSLATFSSRAFPEGAEAGHSGAPGQDDCSACHFAGANPTEYSGLVLEGLPDSVSAGKRYELVLKLSDPEGRVGGFQLYAASDNFGELEPGEGQKTLEQTDANGAQKIYVTHAHPAATEPHKNGEQVAQWRFHWTAPEELNELMFYIAAVAGDGDDSPVGDNVYLLEVPVR